MKYSLAKKIIAALLLLTIIVPIGTLSFPHQTHAQLIVHDPLNMIQNTITASFSGKSLLNVVGWTLAKATLQSIVASTVNWINSGFNGSPGYVTNLGATLNMVADAQAEVYLNQLANAAAIRSPFQDQIAQYIRNNYYRSTARDAILGQNSYTLNLYTASDTAFLAGATTQGGLDAWFAALMNPANTPVGAAELAQDELRTQVGAAQEQRTTELNWGQGILSFRGNCSTPTTSNTNSTSLTSLSSTEPCFGASIQTPGSVIKASLDKAFGSGIDTLVSAHDFDEIVNALLSQLILHISGGSGSLRDLSDSSSNGGSSYFDQTDPSQGTINSVVSSSFTTSIGAQVTQLQQYQSEWNTISNAAQTAKMALSTSGCASDSVTITNVIQPVIDQASTALANTATSLTKLTAIQSELPSASASSASMSTQISQASSDYSAFQSAATTPSPTDLAYAAAQSADTGSATPASLYTQMKQITTTAQMPGRCSTYN